MIKTQLKNGVSALYGCTLAASMLVPAIGAADTINLRSQDDTLNITGEFIDFRDNIYVVRTALGELRLSAERVRCEGSACPVFDTVAANVTFAGSDTVGTGVMPLMLEGFANYLGAQPTLAATNNGNEVVASFVGDDGFGDELGSYLVSSSTSSNAFASLLKGSAEIGMSSRRIRPDEARALRDAGAGSMISPNQEHIVAIDSIVVITHPDNPIQKVSIDDLAKIYTGKITNWSQLGGPNLKIKVIDRPQGGGTQAAFAERVLGENARVVPSAVLANDNTEMASLVNDDEGAIGYTGYSFKRGAKALTLVNECGISMVPDAFSARTEEYSLQRRLYLYNRGDVQSESTKNFLEYAKSPASDALIIKAGFIDLGVDRRSQSLEGERARRLLASAGDKYEGKVKQEMLGVMADYDRLSTTFRFRTGSSRLDERAAIDMQRLTDYLKEQPKGVKVMLVGFTDSVGAFDSNRVLAENRANQVKENLLEFAGGQLDGIELATSAFGEIAPSACNVSDTGRAINRRVEVWIQAAG